MCKVERSPAKMTWLVTYDGQVIDAKDTKLAAQEVADRLNKKYFA